MLRPLQNEEHGNTSVQDLQVFHRGRHSVCVMSPNSQLVIQHKDDD